MAPPGYWTESEQAGRLNVSLRTLRRWRARGYGPKITVVGRAIYYSTAAEAEWLSAREEPVEHPAPRRRRAA